MVIRRDSDEGDDGEERERRRKRVEKIMVRIQEIGEACEETGGCRRREGRMALLRTKRGEDGDDDGGV